MAPGAEEAGIETTTDRPEGTGLGPPLCRSMVEAHGVSLTIESSLGEGTAVMLRFPAERLKLAPAA